MNPCSEKINLITRCKIKIRRQDLNAKLKVKPETQNGTKVKLKGKGFPKYRKKGLYGDLYTTHYDKNSEKDLFSEPQKLR